jgi:GT2 family glycosyltransferase
MSSASAPPATVSVVIVNWNGRHYLETCLASLAAQSYPATEIILVDNGSTDGSVAWVAEYHPFVRLICNERNLGFAAGNNQGLRAANGTYVALLNNDVWAEPGWLAALVAAAAPPCVGSVASLMLFADRPQVINSAGVCVDWCGVSWDRAGGEALADQPQEVTPVFGASGGAALYRREMLLALGGLNDSYFMYLEDVDLAWRARWAGWEAVLAPKARVRHVHSGSSGQGSALKTYYLARNKIHLLLTNYPWPFLWFFAPLLWLYDMLSLANSLLGERTLAGLRGRLAGWASAGQALRARRRVQAARRISPQAIFRWLAPPEWPWRVPRRYAHLRPAPSRAAPARPE